MKTTCRVLNDISINWKSRVISFFCSLLAFNIPQINAQSFMREVIGSAGTYAESAHFSMEWTIGEVIINTYGNSGIYFTQGFHQPNNLEQELVLDFFIPEGFSPNADGINDLLVIRGIDRYPTNKIEIYNRWGNKVYEASPYVNQWDGTSQGGLKFGEDILPIGTYFYLLDLGTTNSFFKGTIYLNK